MKAAPLFQTLLKGVQALVALSLLATTPQGLRAESQPPLPDAGAVDTAREQASLRLQDLATAEPQNFTAILRQVFGSKLTAGAEATLLQQAQARSLPEPASFIPVPAEVLAGAGAAYHAGDGGIVFLNQQALADPEALLRLIVHEWGHHLDEILGAGDAPGEEGEMFQLAVSSGAPLTTATHRYLSVLNDDHALIEWDGQTRAVELGFLSKAFKSVKKVATKTVAPAVKKVATKTVAPAIKKAANTVATKAVTATTTIGTAWKDAAVTAGQATLNAGKNLSGAVASTASGVGNSFGSVASLMAGDEERAARLANKADAQFDQAGKSTVKGLVNVVEVVAAAGDAYNQTTEALDKFIPGLGFAMDMALSITPAGPYIAAVRGVANVKEAADKGDLNGALIAGGIAVLDVGANKLGRYAESAKLARGVDDAVKVPAKVTGRFAGARNTAAKSAYYAKRGFKAVSTPRGITKGEGVIGRSLGKGSGSWLAKSANTSTRYGRFMGRTSKLLQSDSFIVKGLETGTKLSARAKYVLRGIDYFKPQNLDVSWIKPPGGIFSPPRRPPPNSNTPNYIQGGQLGSNGGFFGPFVEGPPPVVITPAPTPVRRPPVFIAPVTPPPTGGTGGTGGSGGSGSSGAGG